MKRGYHFTRAAFLTIGLGFGLLLAVPAQAVPVTTTVEGTVNVADATNPFGLSVGDMVTAVAMYDDAGIPAAGAFSLSLDSDASFALTITLGSFVFVQTDDDDFGSGFPRLLFTDGNLTGIDFERDGFALGGFADLTVGSFNGEAEWFLDDNFGPIQVLLEGSWDFANAVTLPTGSNGGAVPEPAALLLFGVGLAGLFGSRRLYGTRPRRACDGSEVRDLICRGFRDLNHTRLK